MSNFNLVNLFNLTYVKGQQVPTHLAQSTPKISQEVARDGVDLFSLLRRTSRRGAVLYMDATGKNTDRFLPAMVRELYHIANHGSVYRNHFCSLCLKRYRVEDQGVVTTKGQMEFRHLQAKLTGTQAD